MDEAEKELERRSKFLNSLIQKKKAIEQEKPEQQNNSFKIHVRACDMPLPLQNHAFDCARDHLLSMPSKNVDSKGLALALKKICGYCRIQSRCEAVVVIAETETINCLIRQQFKINKRKFHC